MPESKFALQLYNPNQDQQQHLAERVFSRDEVVNEKRKMVGLFIASNIIGAPLMKLACDALNVIHLNTLGNIVKTTGPILLDTWRFFNNNYKANVHNYITMHDLDERIKALEEANSRYNIKNQLRQL